METITCSKCKQTKDVSCFTKDSSKKTGHRPDCRECLKKARQTPERQEVIKEYRKKDYVQKKHWEHRQKPEVKQRLSEYQQKYLSIPEKMAHRKEYFQQESVKQNRREYNKKWISDIGHAIGCRMSSAVFKSLKFAGGKKKRHWEDLVGYTVSELRSHIEKQFQPGMSWENRKKWHIDHIIPKTAFNITSYDCEDFKKCWALKNLQPLWAVDNIRKGGAKRMKALQDRLRSHQDGTEKICSVEP